MKTKTILAAGLVALLSVPLAANANAQQNGRRAAREDVSDSQVQDAITETRVRSLLLEKLGDDAVPIAVRAAGSTVLLSGVVHKRATAELAKEVALSAEGVKDVKVEVKEASPDNPFKRAGKGMKDVGLESLVKNRILVHAGKNAFKVEVEVVDGVVSLRGTVSPDAVDAVLRTARETKGVTKVVDLLQVSRY
ncbi:MAG TPA: BON domain-containing protein [Thermoanaerobaculia bacterium]|nr:BON domain-containing protein [Thermoanaerobaculia bacterium]